MVKLVNAAKNGDFARVKSLLENGANPNSRDYLGLGATALIWAAYRGHTEIVKLLLKHNANPNIQNYFGKTALIWAAEDGWPCDFPD